MYGPQKHKRRVKQYRRERVRRRCKHSRSHPPDWARRLIDARPAPPRAPVADPYNRPGSGVICATPSEAASACAGMHVGASARWQHWRARAHLLRARHADPGRGSPKPYVRFRGQYQRIRNNTRTATNRWDGSGDLRRAAYGKNRARPRQRAPRRRPAPRVQTHTPLVDDWRQEPSETHATSYGCAGDLVTSSADSVLLWRRARVAMGSRGVPGPGLRALGRHSGYFRLVWCGRVADACSTQCARVLVEPTIVRFHVIGTVERLGS